MLILKVQEVQENHAGELIPELYQIEGTLNEVTRELNQIQHDMWNAKAPCKQIYECKGRVAAIRYIKSTHRNSLPEAVRITDMWASNGKWVKPLNKP